LREILKDKVEVISILGNEILSYTEDYEKDLNTWKKISGQQKSGK
jgi:hypothetical protein